MHLVTINNPERLLDTNTDDLRLMDKLVPSSGQLLMVQSQTKSFALVNVTTGQTEFSPVTSANIGQIRRGIVDDTGRTILLTDTPAIVVPDTKNHTIAVETITNPTKNVIDFSIYRTRLYLLDSPGAQIWRHQKTSGGYQPGTPWAKGNVSSLTNATSLAIDGNVFVLLKDGSIMKFFSGTEENWHGQTPITAARNATHLMAPQTQAVLYAFDPETKRVFVWNKETGALIHQYVFPTLRSLLDFSVDDKGQTLYVLSPDGLYKAPLMP